ncbi:hypothetical protein [Amycolatopsis australiensis]|uniref:Uncharacterized protein n=1 Tax=Amycolatopsis australiensis TaxID=546364 RepID=A0A1K1SHR7_9PSEU|nr:hypothetical protein [Amycolatopsis australiensis]SFW83684.1 hypothetical protein SAMN04489730_5694 [Amycolatopsis australiensis]
MKTALRAGLVAILATALAAPAGAATVKQVTNTCHAGAFTGELTLRYETTAGYHHPLGASTVSGPYIGGSGTQLLRISYSDGGPTHMVYSRTSPVTDGEHQETLPAGPAIPVTARGTASAKFDSGTASCTAAVPIS